MLPIFFFILQSCYDFFIDCFYIVFAFFFKNKKIKKTEGSRPNVIDSLKFYKEIFNHNFIINDFLTNFFSLFFFIYVKFLQKKKLFFLKKPILKNNNFNHFSFFSIFNFFKVIIIAFLILVLYFVIANVLETIFFTKIIAFWGSLGSLGYILVSGFNFFTKRYGYNKYTEALQRFWKRSFSIFWLLEGFIFIVFIFLAFNASNEVILGFDPQFFFKLHLYSWRAFIYKLTYNLWIILLVWFLYVKNKKDMQDIYILHLISIFIIYLFYIEFCQFFHFLNHCNFSVWTFFFDNKETTLESDFRKTRIANNYVLICSVAKFWHIIFIFFTWFFYFSKYFESNSSREYMLATNLQNFLILYLLNLISMYPWLKNIFRFYLNDSYFWFFSDFKNFSFLDFFYEAYLVYSNLL